MRIDAGIDLVARPRHVAPVQEAVAEGAADVRRPLVAKGQADFRNHAEYVARVVADVRTMCANSPPWAEVVVPSAAVVIGAARDVSGLVRVAERELRQEPERPGAAMALEREAQLAHRRRSSWY